MTGPVPVAVLATIADILAVFVFVFVFAFAFAFVVVGGGLVMPLRARRALRLENAERESANAEAGMDACNRGRADAAGAAERARR